MFDVLSLDGTYPCKVVLKGAVLESGETKDLACTFLFNRMEQDDINKLTAAIWKWDATRKAIDDGRLLPSATDGEENVTDVHLADRILGGFTDEVHDRNGDPMVYNEENRNKVLQCEGMASAFIASWMKVKGLSVDSEGKKQTSSKSRGSGIGK
jgi:hypothetical protein